jgi:hypothetical protein
LCQEAEVALYGAGIGIEGVSGQAAMGLKGQPCTGMEIGCGEWASIPTDRADEKIRRQMNLLLEVPEEQMGMATPHAGRAAGRSQQKRLAVAQIPHNLQAS